MQINIKAVNLDLTPSLHQFVEEKVGVLAKFLKNHETETEIQCRVEVARTTNHHHHGEVFKATITLDLPGKTLRSVSEKEDIRVAVNLAKREMEQEVKKYNQKSKAQDDKRSYREISKRKGEI